MRTIEFTDAEIKMLCTAIAMVLGELNPHAKKVQMNKDLEDLSEWAK